MKEAIQEQAKKISTKANEQIKNVKKIMKTSCII